MRRRWARSPATVSYTHLDVYKRQEADIIVINTCAVTGEAESKTRKAVRHALGLPREPIVVVLSLIHIYVCLPVFWSPVFDTALPWFASRAACAPREPQAAVSCGVCFFEYLA